MSLKTCWDTFYTNTGNASAIARQLAFAGIAVVWIFTESEEGGLSLHASLLWPSLLFVIALACDFLQYLSGSIVWYCFARHKERKLGADCKDEFGWDDWLNYPGYIFFWSKCAVVLIAYWLLGSYIVNQLQIVG
ncbi:hypothetical protein LG331_08145 [Vreelandella aquamarina]|uniref:hypothetical protein n=1 Tax=Vreelandella aquamarina TaxID=77097 RepID=UPI0038502256